MSNNEEKIDFQELSNQARELVKRVSNNSLNSFTIDLKKSPSTIADQHEKNLYLLFWHQARIRYQIINLLHKSYKLLSPKDNILNNEISAPAQFMATSWQEFTEGRATDRETYLNYLPLIFNTHLINIYPAAILEVEDRFYRDLFAPREVNADNLLNLIAQIKNQVEESYQTIIHHKTLANFKKLNQQILAHQHLVNLSRDFLQIILGNEKIIDVQVSLNEEEQTKAQELLVNLSELELTFPTTSNFTEAVRHLKEAVNHAFYIDYFSMLKKDFESGHDDHIEGWQRIMGFLGRINSIEGNSEQTLLDLLDACNQYLHTALPWYRFGRPYESMKALAKHLLHANFMSSLSEQTMTVDSPLSTKFLELQTSIMSVLTTEELRSRQQSIDLNEESQKLAREFEQLTQQKQNLRQQLLETKFSSLTASPTEIKSSASITDLILKAEIAKAAREKAFQKMNPLQQRKDELYAKQSNPTYDKRTIRLESQALDQPLQEATKQYQESAEIAARAEAKAQQLLQALLTQEESSPTFEFKESKYRESKEEKDSSPFLHLAQQKLKIAQLQQENAQLQLALTQRKIELAQIAITKTQKHQQILRETIALIDQSEMSTEDSDIIRQSLNAQLREPQTQQAEQDRVIAELQTTQRRNTSNLTHAQENVESAERELKLAQRGLAFLQTAGQQAQTQYSSVDEPWYYFHWRGQIGFDRAQQFATFLEKQNQLAQSEDSQPDTKFNETCKYVLTVLTRRQVPGVDHSGFFYNTRSGTKQTSWVIILARLIVTDYLRLDSSTQKALFTAGTPAAQMLQQARNLLQSSGVAIQEEKKEEREGEQEAPH